MNRNDLVGVVAQNRRARATTFCIGKVTNAVGRDHIYSGIVQPTRGRNTTLVGAYRDLFATSTGVTHDVQTIAYYRSSRLELQITISTSRVSGQAKQGVIQAGAGLDEGRRTGHYARRSRATTTTRAVLIIEQEIGVAGRGGIAHTVVVGHDVPLATQQPTGTKARTIDQQTANSSTLAEHGCSAVTSNALFVVSTTNGFGTRQNSINLLLGITIGYLRDLETVVVRRCLCVQTYGNTIIKQRHRPEIADHGALSVNDFTLARIDDGLTCVVGGDFNIVLRT